MREHTLTLDTIVFMNWVACKITMNLALKGRVHPDDSKYATDANQIKTWISKLNDYF